VGRQQQAAPPLYRELAAEVERRWQDRWEADGTFETANPVGALAGGIQFGDRPKLYLLDMFPYPSGYGLHVGHPLGWCPAERSQRPSRAS
jgi:leucyl-tRNA synthetase